MTVGSAKPADAGAAYGERAVYAHAASGLVERRANPAAANADRHLPARTHIKRTVLNHTANPADAGAAYGERAINGNRTAGLLQAKAAAADANGERAAVSNRHRPLADGRLKA